MFLRSPTLENSRSGEHTETDLKIESGVLSSGAFSAWRDSVISPSSASICRQIFVKMFYF